ncbi:MAG: DUF1963 domain-containing protein [Phaeodactylibacter sp.]|nr:DUF1963 domain-containing protein [Phaeodactylibacter sp.]
METLGKGDWILLLQLDSYPELNMYWCDAGRLYFWIRLPDLKARRFDQVWCILQTT